MLAQQTTGDLDIVGGFFDQFESAPYLLLAALTLWALYLVLRSRKRPRDHAPVDVDKIAAAASSEQRLVAAPASRKRYVDIAAKSVLAARVAEKDPAPSPIETTNIDSTAATAQHRKVDEDPFDEFAGFGVFLLAAGFAALLFLLGWAFPGLEAVGHFTTAGWWMFGILTALTIPAIVRKARREKGAERFFTGAAGLAGSAALVAAAVSFLGLGLASPPLRVWWEHSADPQPTTVKTETIVPSSVTFKSGGFGILIGGSAATVSGLVETDNGVRTFSTSRYRYGDEWQLTTEETCTTTIYTSPLLVQEDVDEQLCFTQTIAVLGDELPEH